MRLSNILGFLTGAVIVAGCSSTIGTRERPLEERGATASNYTPAVERDVEMEALTAFLEGRAMPPTYGEEYDLPRGRFYGTKPGLDKAQMLYDAQDEETKKLIDAGKVAIGMDFDQVWLALGQPMQQKETITVGAKYTHWSWSRSGARVMFKNGVLAQAGN